MVYGHAVAAAGVFQEATAVNETAPAKDARGMAVPSRLQKVFQGRAELLRWRAKLQVLADELSQFEGESFARDVDVLEERRQLILVVQRVSLAAPYMLCDCDVHDHFCKKCNGSRWTSAKRQLEATGQLPK